MKHGGYTTVAIFGDDATSLAGSQRIKAQIERYWRERGHQVHLRLVKMPYNQGAREAAYRIESDLLNGLPRQCVKAEQAA